MTWELKLTRVALIKIIQLLWPCSVSKAKKKKINEQYKWNGPQCYIHYELS